MKTVRIVVAKEEFGLAAHIITKLMLEEGLRANYLIQNYAEYISMIETHDFDQLYSLNALLIIVNPKTLKELKSTHIDNLHLKYGISYIPVFHNGGVQDYLLEDKDIADFSDNFEAGLQQLTKNLIASDGKSVINKFKTMSQDFGLGGGAPNYGDESGDAPSIEKEAPAEDSFIENNEETEQDVYLSCAAVNKLQKGEEMTARFAAYIEDCKYEVEKTLSALSESSTVVLDYVKSRWKEGLEVTVKLSSNHLLIEDPIATFKWNGRKIILDFDVKAPDEIPGTRSILKFNVYAAGIPVAKMRMDVEIAAVVNNTNSAVNTIIQKPIKSAFASYASEDKNRVLDRVSEISRNGVDVFLDCLSLHPGEQWKSKLETEIMERDIFLLFWSANAKASEWVTWEWNIAYNKKNGIEGIEPHPLDDPAIAPPPEKLNELHFNDVYNLIRK